MVGLARQQIERVRKKWKYSTQGTLRTRRISWQVQHERIATYTAYTAAKRCERRALRAVLTDQLRKTGDEPIADSKRRFRCHVTSCKPGASSGQHKITEGTCFTQRRSNQVLLVRHSLLERNFSTCT